MKLQILPLRVNVFLSFIELGFEQCDRLAAYLKYQSEAAHKSFINSSRVFWMPA